jgi:HTH-type transcriptional regulator, quorum sensing regulator NprR
MAHSELNVKVLKKMYERLHSEKKDESKIGTILKQRRKALGLKQSCVAHQIISVSHYSKIENNRTIPTTEILVLLLEKLKLDLNALPQTISKAFLDEAITSYFYEDAESLDRIITHKADQLSLSALTLSNYFLAILNRDLATSTQCFYDLKSLYRSFDEDEFVAWILAMMAEAFLKHDYRIMIEYSYILDPQQLSKPIHNVLFYLLSYQGYLFLNRYPVAQMYLQHLKKELERFNHAHYQELIHLYELYFIVLECPYTANRLLMNEQFRQYSKRNHNLIALIRLELAIRLKQPLPEITPNEAVKDEWFYRLLVRLCEVTDCDPKEHFEHQNPFNAPFISLYKLSKLDASDERYRFIQEDAVKMLYRHQDTLTLKPVIQEGADYLKVKSRYKDVIRLENKYTKLVMLPETP